MFQLKFCCLERTFFDFTVIGCLLAGFANVMSWIILVVIQASIASVIVANMNLDPTGNSFAIATASGTLGLTKGPAC